MLRPTAHYVRRASLARAHEQVLLHILVLYTACREFCLLATTGAAMKQNYTSSQAPRTLPDTLQLRMTNRNTCIARNAMAASSCGMVKMALKPQIWRTSRKASPPKSNFKALMPSFALVPLYLWGTLGGTDVAKKFKLQCTNMPKEEVLTTVQQQLQ